MRACARTIQSAAHMLRTHVVHVTGGDGQLLADDAILAYKGPLVIVSQ